MIKQFLVAGMLIVPHVLWAAGQSSATFSVVADVFTTADPGLAIGSAQFQSSLSVGQLSIAGRQTSTTFVNPEGYQATVDGFDSDYDGVADNEDSDSDNDGTNDSSDSRPYDTDNDTVNNLDDSDDDGEGLTDFEEFLEGTSRTDSDTDDDSYSDYEEASVAETDPLDEDSYLQCVQIERSSTNVLVYWDSSVGVTYFVQRLDDLTNSAAWTAVAGPIVATDVVTSVTDTNTSAQYSYRVQIPY